MNSPIISEAAHEQLGGGSRSVNADPSHSGVRLVPRRRTRRAEPSTGLGRRLRQRRKECSLTQVELAEQVGTSQAVIQKIENGKSLRPRILDQIAQVLEVPPAWLMFGIEEAGELSEDAIEFARAWSKLKEPHRGAMRDAILRIGGTLV